VCISKIWLIAAPTKCQGRNARPAIGGHSGKRKLMGRRPGWSFVAGVPASRILLQYK